MDKKPLIAPPVMVVLLVLESFFLTYIYLGTIDLLYVLLLFGIFLVFIWFLLKIYKIYRTSLELTPDVDDNRSGEKFRRQLYGSLWKEGIPIWGLFICQIIFTSVFVVLDLPLLFLFIFLGFITYMTSRFIKLADNNTWVLMGYLVNMICNTILLLTYFYYLWVIICVSLSWGLIILIVIDLDYLQLQAYIPNILLTLSFYHDPLYHIWVLPIAVANFLYWLIYYGFK